MKEIKTVEECFYQIRNGANIKQGLVDGGYPITRIETIANDRFNRDRMGYAGITDLNKYDSYILEDGDLLMSHINSLQYLGRTVLYTKQNDEIIIHGMNLLNLKANRSIVIPAFIQYYFQSRLFKEQLLRITKKSVNQASFTVSDLKKIKLSVPNINEQKQIVNTLDKALDVISARKEELFVLDELIKARFVEMFGDVNVSSDTICLASVCKSITDGSHNPPKGIIQSDNYMISSQNIQNGTISFNDVRFLSDDDFFKEDKRTNIRKDDVLLTIVGALGRSAVVIDNKKIAAQRSVCVIHPNAELLNSVFLKYMLDNISSQIENEAHGIAQKGIYLKQVKDLQIICPEKKKQDEFADFVKEVDKSKVVVQKALDEAQTLFDSLMQEYFG